jgi:pimeloyl-ACP methyl ester carboxylesterase
MSNVMPLPRTDRPSTKPIVIALHCSGATGAQWRHLGRELGQRFTVITPDLMGSGATPHWRGDARKFRMTDEAARIVCMIDAAKRPVHLVGHSYGACVALRAAVERSSKIASISLYEPAAFHLLKVDAHDGKAALVDITMIAARVDRLVSGGKHADAAKEFLEYWNGAGTWDAMRPDARAMFARYIRKAPLEFHAALSEPIALHAYRRVNVPTLLLQGEFAPKPTRVIARLLAKAMRRASLQTVYGAGHMGPFSHADVVSAMTANWILSHQPGMAATERFARNLDQVA